MARPAQAAGQLVDTLVVRGYLVRSTDPNDRRKLSITLTPPRPGRRQGRAAARQRIDDGLAARVGPECVAQMRRALAVLCEMGRREGGEDAGD